MKAPRLLKATIDQVSSNERVIEVYLGAVAMLDVKSVDLHYGAAQALRGVSMHAAVGRGDLRAGEETAVGKRRACSTRWPVSNRSAAALSNGKARDNHQAQAL